MEFVAPPMPLGIRAMIVSFLSEPECLPGINCIVQQGRYEPRMTLEVRGYQIPLVDTCLRKYDRLISREVARRKYKGNQRMVYAGAIEEPRSTFQGYTLDSSFPEEKEPDFVGALRQFAETDGKVNVFPDIGLAIHKFKPFGSFVTMSARNGL